MLSSYSAVAGASIVTGAICCGLAKIIDNLGILAARACEPEEEPAPIEKQSLYLYVVNGEVRGPVPMAQLRAMRALPADVRMVTGETLVCHHEQTNWLRLADLMG